MDTTPSKPGLTSCLGALGILVAAVAAPIGLLSIASAPFEAVAFLVAACAGAGMFVRGWLADRRWRGIQRTMIQRHAAAGREAARYLSPTGGVTHRGGRFGMALRTFLDDPDGLVSLVLDGPGMFHLRFALLPTDRNVLFGQAVAMSRLDPDHRPPQDAWLGLVTLGWAAPERPTYREAGAGIAPREGFAAEWTLPIDIDEFERFVHSTAKVYGIDPTLLRPRFEAVRPGQEMPELDGLPRAAAPAAFDPSVSLRRWSRHPAVQFASFAIAIVLLAAGRDGIGAFFRAVPPVLMSGGLAVLFLVVALHLLNRYLRTADPFSLTGWNWVRRRTVTHYQRHVWWGIFGVGSAIIGIFFVVQALTASSR